MSINISDETRNWAEHTWDRIDKKMQKVSVRSRFKIPDGADKNGVHTCRGNQDIQLWTNGFWGGMMWLMYTNTQNEVYKITALETERSMDKAFEIFDGLHHDVGFMWNITSGVNYRITGDKTARNRFMYASGILASRYNPEGGYITAWPGSEQEGWTIIDTMMNLPLLYRTSQEPGYNRYKAIAEAHADMAMKEHVRSDGSVNHIVVHDINSHEVIDTPKGQGYEKGSSWSRGQAWAIYGFVLSYIHTGKVKYLETAKKVAHYFITSCCNDWLVRCDFRAPAQPVIYDSTAACCAACGLIEIARSVTQYEKGAYLSAAINLLKACDKNFCNYDENTDYLVGYGTRSYPNPGRKSLIHIPIIYGDYYFIEALSKLRGSEFLPW